MSQKTFGRGVEKDQHHREKLKKEKVTVECVCGSAGGQPIVCVCFSPRDRKKSREGEDSISRSQSPVGEWLRQNGRSDRPVLPTSTNLQRPT